MKGADDVVIRPGHRVLTDEEAQAIAPEWWEMMRPLREALRKAATKRLTA